MNGKKSEAVVRKCSVTKLFLKILQTSQEKKLDSGAGVFLWILRNFYKQLFYGTSLAAACEKYEHLVNVRFTQRL